jgi:predicted transcriptional regulator
MSNTKHTPGPWEYASGDNASCEINIGPTTAWCDRADKNTGEYVISREEMQANATLIASAPTLYQQNSSLLEALKEIIKISDRKHDAWDKAKELIQQIENQTS